MHVFPRAGIAGILAPFVGFVATSAAAMAFAIVGASPAQAAVVCGDGVLGGTVVFETPYGTWNAIPITYSEIIYQNGTAIGQAPAVPDSGMGYAVIPGFYNVPFGSAQGYTEVFGHTVAGPGVAAQKSKPGDVVVVSDSAGHTACYVVTHIEHYAWNAIVSEPYDSTHPGGGFAWVGCTDYNAALGKHVGRVVVYADRYVGTIGEPDPPQDPAPAAPPSSAEPPAPAAGTTPAPAPDPAPAAKDPAPSTVESPATTPPTPSDTPTPAPDPVSPTPQTSSGPTEPEQEPTTGMTAAGETPLRDLVSRERTAGVMRADAETPAAVAADPSAPAATIDAATAPLFFTQDPQDDPSSTALARPVCAVPPSGDLLDQSPANLLLISLVGYAARAPLS